MKKLIILLMLIFTTGCTVDYNIIVKTDKTINEEIVISEKNSVIENEGYTVDDSVKAKIDSYKPEISKYGFEYKVKKETNNFSVILTSKNKTMESFTKFTYFQKMFNGADINYKNKKYTFKTNGVYNQAGLFYDLSGIADEGFVDKININIQFHNVVLKSNADKVDDTKNIYTWVLDANTKEKTIEFKLSDKIREDVYDKSLYETEKKGISFQTLVTIISVISAVIILILYALILNKRSNMI